MSPGSPRLRERRKSFFSPPDLLVPIYDDRSSLSLAYEHNLFEFCTGFDISHIIEFIQNEIKPCCEAEFFYLRKAKEASCLSEAVIKIAENNSFLIRAMCYEEFKDEFNKYLLMDCVVRELTVFCRQGVASRVVEKLRESNIEWHVFAMFFYTLFKNEPSEDERLKIFETYCVSEGLQVVLNKSEVPLCFFLRYLYEMADGKRAVSALSSEYLWENIPIATGVRHNDLREALLWYGADLKNHSLVGGMRQALTNIPVDEKRNDAIEKLFLCEHILPQVIMFLQSSPIKLAGFLSENINVLDSSSVNKFLPSFCASSSWERILDEYLKMNTDLEGRIQVLINVGGFSSSSAVACVLLPLFKTGKIMRSLEDMWSCGFRSLTVYIDVLCTWQMEGVACPQQLPDQVVKEYVALMKREYPHNILVKCSAELRHFEKDPVEQLFIIFPPAEGYDRKAYLQDKMLHFIERDPRSLIEFLQTYRHHGSFEEMRDQLIWASVCEENTALPFTMLYRLWLLLRSAPDDKLGYKGDVMSQIRDLAKNEILIPYIRVALEQHKIRTLVNGMLYFEKANDDVWKDVADQLKLAVNLIDTTVQEKVDEWRQAKDLLSDLSDVPQFSDICSLIEAKLPVHRSFSPSF